MLKRILEDTALVQYDMLVKAAYRDRCEWMDARRTEDERVATENWRMAHASRRASMAVLAGRGLSRLGEALAATGGRIRCYGLKLVSPTGC
jgi:hypothetical protein